MKVCFCPAASSTVEDKSKKKHAVFLARGNKAIARKLREGFVEMKLRARVRKSDLRAGALRDAATNKSCVEVEVEKKGKALKLVGLGP